MSLFSKLTTDDDLLIKIKLKEGNIVVFNNNRMMNGRTKYEDSSIINR